MSKTTVSKQMVDQEVKDFAEIETQAVAEQAPETNEVTPESEMVVEEKLGFFEKMTKKIKENKQPIMTVAKWTGLILGGAVVTNWVRNVLSESQEPDYIEGDFDVVDSDEE